MSSQAIEGLEPAAVWEFFAELASVPRPSKKEERVRDHVKQLAEKQGFACRVDGVGNLIVSVPASKGCESAPVTVIQGHLDMVCEKNSDTAHDFDREPIKLVREQSSKGETYLRADGTTLGADNGIGVALGFAAATSPDVKHGPLELLMTLDEEAGMSGAKGLAPDAVSGKRLLNLDSEEDDAIYIGCAGGSDVNMRWQFALEKTSSGFDAFELKVSGLRGGHSGGDIHEGRGSAIKLLARTLLRSGIEDLRLGGIDGGSMRNAIPREASAIVVGSQADYGALSSAATEVNQEAVDESNERDAVIAVRRLDGPPDRCLSAAASTSILRVLAALPHGVLGMHPKVPELVETSNNIATIKMVTSGDKAELAVGNLVRSSSGSRIAEAIAQLRSVGELSGGEVDTANEYPGWSPNPDSALLGTCRRVYREMFGKEPNVLAIHAGLECGLIGERVGGMDMVSFGPRIEGAHSPDERVYVDSVGKIWKYLKAVLAELAG